MQWRSIYDAKFEKWFNWRILSFVSRTIIRSVDFTCPYQICWFHMSLSDLLISHVLIRSVDFTCPYQICWFHMSLSDLLISHVLIRSVDFVYYSHFLIQIMQIKKHKAILQSWLISNKWTPQKYFDVRSVINMDKLPITRTWKLW